MFHKILIFSSFSYFFFVAFIAVSLPFLPLNFPSEISFSYVSCSWLHESKASIFGKFFMVFFSVCLLISSSKVIKAECKEIEILHPSKRILKKISTKKKRAEKSLHQLLNFFFLFYYYSMLSSCIKFFRHKGEKEECSLSKIKEGWKVDTHKNPIKVAFYFGVFFEEILCCLILFFLLGIGGCCFWVFKVVGWFFLNSFFITNWNFWAKIDFWKSGFDFYFHFCWISEKFLLKK